MLKHIVMWKFADEALGHTKEENIKTAVEGLSSLPEKIPQIKSLSVGPDVSKTDMSFDCALIVECENREDLAVYAEHPEHMKVRKFIRQVVTQRVVADLFE